MSTISRSKRLPLYFQLKELIIDKIEGGEWQYGDLIPTEIQLGTMFDLSRTTVRQALTELVTEGVLERIQGKGTYVSYPKLEPIRPDVTGFTQDMVDKGHIVSSIVHAQEFVKADEKLRRILNLQPNSEVYKLKRLRLVDGTVIGYHEAYLNHQIAPFVDFSKYDFSKDSLYQSLMKEGITWGESDETVEAGLASETYGDLLNIKSESPILKLSRTTRLEDGQPYEYATMVYRADKYRYSIKLR
ncbi:GntR family transcriptional regulator [Aquibacillus koreensis]|uniref:GntR family transcriptional regulator n=1 Tax=Aquibacillus koreensis TaxID=279446 RepID=A0A9X4AIR2_9BACI|nr:GntR family transcriptional regulator [Aquibacillus koreensis]MCT2534740.1 GntR family transcriptional regulator [Aquibacillus koreensis]MDC3419650.1 GntR family transcriptional regulator [Aquibacillus koreensis]